MLIICLSQQLCCVFVSLECPLTSVSLWNSLTFSAPLLPSLSWPVIAAPYLLLICWPFQCCNCTTLPLGGREVLYFLLHVSWYLPVGWLDVLSLLQLLWTPSMHQGARLYFYYRGKPTHLIKCLFLLDSISFLPLPTQCHAYAHSILSADISFKPYGILKHKYWLKKELSIHFCFYR